VHLLVNLSLGLVLWLFWTPWPWTKRSPAPAPVQHAQPPSTADLIELNAEVERSIFGLLEAEFNFIATFEALQGRKDGERVALACIRSVRALREGRHLNYDGAVRAIKEGRPVEYDVDASETDA
jgi:hypothetical protein